MPMSTGVSSNSGPQHEAHRLYTEIADYVLDCALAGTSPRPYRISPQDLVVMWLDMRALPGWFRAPRICGVELYVR